MSLKIRSGKLYQEEEDLIVLNLGLSTLDLFDREPDLLSFGDI